MQASNEIERIIKRAGKQGWRRRDTGGGHIMLYAPDKVGMVTVSKDANFRSLKNFMAELKKHGYKEKDEVELKTNGHDHGDAPFMEPPTEAQAVEETRIVDPYPTPQPVEKKVYPSVASLVADYYAKPERTLGESYDIPTTLEAVRVHNPNANTASVQNAVINLVAKGRLIRSDRGRYRLAPTGVAVPVHETTPTATTAPVEVKPVAALHEEFLEQDIQTLDECLEALSKIDTVVRRTRDRILKIKQLKEALA